jgi:hypothetical protein
VVATKTAAHPHAVQQLHPAPLLVLHLPVVPHLPPDPPVGLTTWTTTFRSKRSSLLKTSFKTPLKPVPATGFFVIVCA